MKSFGAVARFRLVLPLQAIRKVIQRTVPYPLRVEIARLRMVPKRLSQRHGIARARSGRGEFPYIVAEQSTPLQRGLAATARARANKRQNVHTAAVRITGLVVQPHELFSFHAAVGRPSLLRGFRRGIELHDERAAAGTGGGMCKVSNLLYLLALRGGMKIVERHRHALDLFPDQDRIVPFGCGATVAYNYADLRFENPLPTPILLDLSVTNTELIGQLRMLKEPDWRAEVYETDHRFVARGDGWWRENRIRRRIRDANGAMVHDELVAHNSARVLYEPHLALAAPTMEPLCSAH